MEYKTLEIRGAQIMNERFRHFKKGKYGYSFCIDLSKGESVKFGGKPITDPEELVKELEEDMWKVQYTRPTNPMYTPDPFLEVKINFNNKFNPPYIVVNGADYGEDMIGALQSANFKHVNIAINPARPTERNDGSVKRTAYLGSLHADLFEDGEYTPERYADPFA